MGGWFKYEKEFEEAEKKDKRGAIFTVHYENLKKVEFIHRAGFNNKSEINISVHMSMH